MNLHMSAGEQASFVEKKETDLFQASSKGESNIYEKITFSLYVLLHG